MRTNKRLLCLALCAVIASCAFAQAEIFKLPQGISVLESEALSDIAMPDGILLPESLVSIAPDAFDDTLVYGVSGGKAEAYAKTRGLEFRSIDISNVSIDVPAFASPYRYFDVSADADSILPYETVFRVYRDGQLYCETSPSQDGKGKVILYEGGLYDYTVTLSNPYTSAQVTFEGETEIYEPVRLVQNRWFVRVGESFRPVDETEGRKVELSCDSDGLTISDDTITAKKLGTYTITAVAEQAGESVYTDFEVNVVIPAEAITVDRSEIELYIGGSFSPEISIVPEDASDCVLRFSSSDPSIACIDEGGVIHALGQGEAVITVETFDAAATIRVRVKMAAESVSILLPDSGNTMTCGDRIKLHYAILPENSDDIGVHWTSSDESVLKVDAAGYVSALKPGSARISAACEDNPGIRDEAEIIVVSGTQTILADVPEWMYVGEERALEVKTEPAASLNDLEIGLSDADVVEINGSRLKALAPGECAITFTSADHLVKSYGITVYERCASINARISELYLNTGMTASLSDVLVFEPLGCLVGTLHYSSSESAVVTVGEDGIVKAVSEGTALIHVDADGVCFELKVNVVTDGKVISSVAVSSSYLVLVCGATGTISPVISSADGKYKSGEWYSDDPETVRIESVGAGGAVTVKALKPGTAHICMVSTSGLSARCEVLVNPVALKSISSDMKSCTLDPGESVQFEYQLNPALADTSGMYAYSSNAAVAEIDDSGMITAVGAGECEVFVFVGDLAVSCHVSVNALMMQEAWLCESEYRGKAGQAAQICYKFTPENATPAAFSWSSDDTGIAQVDPLSGKIFYKAAGETDLHAEALDGSGLSLNVHVIVDEVPVRSLTLSQDAFTFSAGESADILYSVYPYGASYSDAVFESADENIAKVDESGHVTAMRSGSTELFVTVGKGDYQITKTVSVTVNRVTETQYRAFIMGQFTVPGSKGYLPFSLNSTRAVYDALSLSTLDAAGYVIRFMPASPTIESVRSGIKSIAQMTDEDDVTVVYLLTHGSYNEKSGYYMQFSNGKEYYANTILADVEQISGHVLLVFDSCHSGRALLCSEVGKLRSSGGVYQGLNGTGHLSIICGSTDTKSTYYDVSNPNEAYDFFTKAFAQGLGWNMLTDTRMDTMADRNSDGKVTVSELFNFVRPQTQNLISAYVQLHGTNNFVGNPNQYPSCFIAEGEENLVIWGR